MTLVFVAALFFVVIFSVIVQLIVKCPYVPAAIVALISLIVYAVLSETLGTIFIAWIIIYTLTALLAAWLTNVFIRNNRCNRCNQNDNCNCNRCNLNEGCNSCDRNCNRCNLNESCNSCDCNDF